MNRFTDSPSVVLFLSVVLLLIIPAKSFGQAVYGSIVGTVTDSTGAVVPGAKVTVTNVQKGTTANVTTSNAGGNYSVQHLIPDVYVVQIEAPSFATAKAENVKVSADSTVRVDMPLKVASSQTVEVTV